MTSADRRQLIASQSAVTGLDYVYVDSDQVTLDVHFLRSPATLDAPLPGSLNPDQVNISPVEVGDPQVELTGLAWVGPPGAEDVLRLTVARSGGFSDYVLRIGDNRVDAYFAVARFNFKANCPTDFDCGPDCPTCPPDKPVDFPVDYSARDFWSYRRSLLDFAAQRYPGWEERAEADFGVMVTEALSALADEMSYYQDRVGREAYLETATQRRSLRGHARLVDYHIHNGRGATGWLAIEASNLGLIPAGTPAWALSAEDERIDFSVGAGLRDNASYDVSPALNALGPHIWDEDVVCLDAGATHLDLSGAHAADLVFNDPPADPAGRWVVIQTAPEDPGIPSRTQLVRVTNVSEHMDPLLSTTVTRISWEHNHRINHQMELASMTVCANIVPVTAGRTMVNRFTIGPSDDSADRPSAIERLGRLVEEDAPCDCGDDPCRQHAYRSTTYRYSLPGTPEHRLVWLGDPVEDAEPEIQLAEVVPSGSAWDDRDQWMFRRSFVAGVGSSLPQDPHFVLEDGKWAQVVAYRRSGTEITHVDYASSEGVTVRFGDGEFGRLPEEGAVFQATYRVGNGPVGNLPAGAIGHIDPTLSFVAAVHNPLPTAGGVDPESPEEVRMLAPERFRAEPLSAVRPEDYADAAERLNWVQRAGATFRWTGSWQSAFVTPDPQGSVAMTRTQANSAVRQLDRYRQAGREVHATAPRYADLDLDVVICANESSFPGEVQERVMEALFGPSAFFSTDRFTFGTPLERSALEAHIKAVEGVLAVRSISIRRRGWFDWRPLEEFIYNVGDDEIIRIENDPDRPAHGILFLEVEGGA